MTLYCSFCERLNFLHNVYYLIFYNRTKVFDYVLTFGCRKIVVFRSPFCTRSDSSPGFVEYKRMDPQKFRRRICRVSEKQ